MKYTRQEAIIAAVLWWQESITKPLNQDIGAQSSAERQLELLMLNHSSDNQAKITKEATEVFYKELVESLASESGQITLDVDYHPCQILGDALAKSGIDPSVLPCKTWMVIRESNEVIVSEGYRATPINI